MLHSNYIFLSGIAEQHIVMYQEAIVNLTSVITVHWPVL